MPNLIKQADSRYVTAHYGKWHIIDRDPAECGYDFSDGKTDNTDANRPEDKVVGNPDPKRIFELTDRSIDFIETQHAAGNPFFLQISHYAVHWGFRGSPDMLDKYGDLYDAGLPEDQRHTDWVYAAMNEDLDAGVGSILDALDNLGLTNNTYVFFTSDNGYQLYATDDASSLVKELYSPETKSFPLSYGKTYLYEGGIRVPFIVRGPGIAKNSVCRVPVVGYDLMPTFLDLINPGSLPPSYTEGGNLVPLLKNAGVGTVERPDDFFIFQEDGAISMRKGDYKIVFEPMLPAVVKFEVPEKLYCFNLSNDISETNDLAALEPTIVFEMYQEAMDYLQSVNGNIPNIPIIPLTNNLSIEWSAQTISNASAVSNRGTLLEALNFNDEATTNDAIINGVTFSSFDGDNTSSAVYFSSGHNLAADTDRYLIPPGVVAFDTLLSHLVFGADAVVLSNLTVGQEYEVQLFFAQNWNSVTEYIIMDLGAVNELGSLASTQYRGSDRTGIVITGSFVANASSQMFSINLDGSKGAGKGIINGYQLRAIDSTSRPVITDFIVNPNGTVSVNWSSGSGSTYSLLSTTNLSDSVSSWTVVTNNIPDGSFQPAEMYSDQERFFMIEKN
ncbi:Arylsulfatase [Pontiella sulfatireligans]|uniref:Arylsulfatase n=1 Tax=Pontiella sulfatireligans TaxID=2750658 RepID=A0A6C2URX3_9BACT|nr:sulfatase S1_16 [Kiritimatiellales bacterium]VGO22703.1 Arylsulfatase [Pontiella sulfatireligans]